MASAVLVLATLLGIQRFIIHFIYSDMMIDSQVPPHDWASARACVRVCVCVGTKTFTSNPIFIGNGKMDV